MVGGSATLGSGSQHNVPHDEMVKRANNFIYLLLFFFGGVGGVLKSKNNFLTGLDQAAQNIVQYGPFNTGRYRLVQSILIDTDKSRQNCKPYLV